jgi:hypothetical protein
MRILILSLALIAPPVLAETDEQIRNMVGQCECAMAPGSTCKVDADRYMKPGTRKFVNGGIVPAEVYNEIKRLGKGMCGDIPHAYAQGTRRFNEGYRWMFRKEPVDCFIPPK